LGPGDDQSELRTQNIDCKFFTFSLSFNALQMVSLHTFEAIEMTYAPSESLPNSAATLKVSRTSFTSAATYTKEINTNVNVLV
jgi:hypothetical protein